MQTERPFTPAASSELVLLMCVSVLMLLVGRLQSLNAAPQDAILDEANKIQFEAAFQGRCDRGSPCEQLCYEIHDGMYECDCKAGYNLRADGYSCYESNSTTTTPPEPPSTSTAYSISDDFLYERDAILNVMEVGFFNGTAIQELRNNYDVSFGGSGDAGRGGSAVLNVHTTQGPRLEQKLTEDMVSNVPTVTYPISTVKPCQLDCGPGGSCARFRQSDQDRGGGGSFTFACLCPLGKGGDQCQADVEIRSPRFSGSSWMAFPALRGAYKRVQVNVEVRPEAYDGIFFLTGERDDMAGDFMALLLHQGFVEFRFDCGSGLGVVRSQETVLLNQWNRISLYRHRWDAWLQLNGGKHVQGRSKGLFSRITFREPLYVGGIGNTTGLLEKLPVSGGLKGCIRHLEVNDHAYKFALEPRGESIKGFGVAECTEDRCSRVPCQHGGKCLVEQHSAVCLCPLGFSGDLCEIRVDLRVPSFNGSSYLRYRGLAEDALTWLDLEIVLKPTTSTGLILHNGYRSNGYGDFLALYLDKGFVHFAFDLGTGAGLAISTHPIATSKWHKIKVSRTGRLAVLWVDDQIPVEVMAPGAFTQLSLPLNMYLGGVPNTNVVSPQVSVHESFAGCIQKLQINGRNIAILAEALGGTNVDNCPHPCVARPCGDQAECIPDMDYFMCKCKMGKHHNSALCNATTTTTTTTTTTNLSRIPPSFRQYNSYMHFSDPLTLDTLQMDPLDLNVRFRTTSQSGLLLWSSTGFGIFISLGLEMGSLVLRFSNEGDESIVVMHNTTTVCDNLWHRVKAVRDGSTGLLVVDNGPAITRQLVEIPHESVNMVDAADDDSRTSVMRRGLYVGGMPSAHLQLLTAYKHGIRGCIADLALNGDYHMDLVNLRQTHGDIAHNVGECQSL